MIKFLLEKGADQSLDLDDGSKATISDLAWFEGNYDIVVELILADGTYPQYFEIEKMEELQKLRIETVFSRVSTLHEQIESNLFEEVVAFAEKYPKTKYAYDVSNKSASTKALEFKNFKIYSFLRFRGFSCGIDNKHNFHMLDLVSKSQLGMNNDRKHFEKLQKYFEKLDKFENFQPILKIVASEKALSMIFDFNRGDIDNLDPAGNPLNEEFKVRGRTYDKTKKILIAASQRDEGELLGILAQELTHFALLKVYGNEFLPYRKNDDANKTKFVKIMKSCRDLKGEEKIIDDAFKYREKKIIAKKLIARVPQLVAQNSPEELSKNRETFKDLFEYYNQKVLKDFELEVSHIVPKQSVQSLNRDLGLLHHLKTSKMRCRACKTEVLEMLQEPGNIFVPTKLLELVLSNIIDSFKLLDSENLFIELYQLTIGSTLDAIGEIFNVNWRPTLFVIDSVNLDHDRIATILNKISECKIVFISSREVQEGFRCHPEVSFYFGEVNSDSKQELLRSQVDFQYFKVK